MWRLALVALVLSFAGCEQPETTSAPRIVAVTAKWCQPCQADKRFFDDIRSEGFELTVIDIDEDRELAIQYGADRQVPLYVVYDGDGTQVEVTGDLKTAWKVLRFLLRIRRLY